jgi:hypothetical protein
MALDWALLCRAYVMALMAELNEARSSPAAAIFGASGAFAGSAASGANGLAAALLQPSTALLSSSGGGGAGGAGGAPMVMMAGGAGSRTASVTLGVNSPGGSPLGSPKKLGLTPRSHSQTQGMSFARSKVREG